MNIINEDIITFMKFSLFIFLMLFLFLFLIFIFKKVVIFFRRKSGIKNNDFVRKYLADFKENKLTIIDETPRVCFIGNKYYTLKPLKYRQYTRLCILFAKTLEKINGLNVDLKDIDKTIGLVTENAEDDFFRAIACVLFFSNNEFEDNEKNIISGINDEFNYIKDYATLEELSNVLGIISAQNDIQKALASFGSITSKKKTT